MEVEDLIILFWCCLSSSCDHQPLETRFPKKGRMGSGCWLDIIISSFFFFSFFTPSSQTITTRHLHHRHLDGKTKPGFLPLRRVKSRPRTPPVNSSTSLTLAIHQSFTLDVLSTGLSLFKRFQHDDTSIVAATDCHP